MSDELCLLSVAEAADLIARRRLSPVELTEACLARIEALNPQLDAFVTLTAERARAQAREAESEIAAGRRRGPLHGVPFGLKDMFETRGIRTTAHSRILRDHVPARDATAVSRLYAAGGVLLGKLATHEFAHGGPSFDLPWPPARNPWNTAHFTGGSSSGSAAAVAAGLMPVALGTDTGGSIRSPAWLCGVVGLKPTFGRVSRAGVIPFSESCDHVGPITRTVEDAAILLQALAGHDPADRGSAQRAAPDPRAGLDAGVRGLRIGFVRHFSEADLKVNDELRCAVDGALAVLQTLGAHVDDVRLRSLHDYYSVRVMLTESEQFSLHLKNLRQRPGDYGHHFLGRCLPACLFTAPDYLSAQRERRRIQREMDAVFERWDALVTVGAGPAPPLADHRRIGAADWWVKPGMGALGSVTGAPALALPCGFSASGLPLGFQIIGRPWQDATVLRIGRAYESAVDWRRRRPPLAPGAGAPPPVDTAATAAPRLDEAYRARAAEAARRAGLELSEAHFDLLLESAPSALALAARLPRDHARGDEMASVFTLP
jgi:aspartyl-tRNA(Asn)/glutamyl-tRNA(Gln) amidotransferase subunit A